MTKGWLEKLEKSLPDIAMSIYLEGSPLRTEMWDKWELDRYEVYRQVEPLQTRHWYAPIEDEL